MGKLVMVAVLVGALVAGSTPAGAQTIVAGGLGDPLTLASSGVLVPYLTTAGVVTLLEVASPVGDNSNLHMEFFDASCQFVGPSVGLPLTTNDIAFLALPTQVPSIDGNDGLIAISGVDDSGFVPAPLKSPIHARAYTFAADTGQSRVFEPIILDTAEFGLDAGQPFHTWSPLRTAATFFSPQQTDTVRTLLRLICPRALIQGPPGTTAAANAYFRPGLGFPAFVVSENGGAPNVGFPIGEHRLRARVYDTNEAFLRNLVPILCSCNTNISLASDFVPGADIYSSEIGGTYTELEEVPGNDGDTIRSSAFTGYKSVFTMGSALNNFFGRLSNGSRPSIQGNLFNTR